MPLHIVPLTAGTASLGCWGSVVLSGGSPAILRLARSEDLELPLDVDADITAGVLLLNDELGRLLYLPYAGDSVVSYDLERGEDLFPAIHLRRDADHGMRTAEVRIAPGLGVVHLTEVTLMLFTEECALAWRRDDNFAGWSIEEITHQELVLMAGDWSGREERQTRSLEDGRRTQ
ncbi:hypothetical protein [Kribbella sp. ALI-6-A]|uniref:hypothetical protein n=1 Tax=Kribbella sp. ALI-6-A TaxID=1933817 RepID=UPI00117B00C6|nr:hypothetical protein [Kribbella sp. ALI-6-A]